MSPIRVVVAAVAGGTVMFVWGAIAHMVLPIGEMGIKELPAEEVLLPAIGQHVTEPGFYMFPGIGAAGATDEAMEAWQRKWEAGPRGVLIADPGPGEFMPPTQLGVEWGADVLAAAVLAIVLGWLPCTFMGKTLVAGALGLFAWLTVDVSYWNWYKFPPELVLGGLIDQAIGWLGAGAVIAAIVRGRPCRGDAEPAPA
ncbi:MAG TPA: hypothetical protein VFF69_05435 [Phycisphaerales bacterium]|nr:hypothetical protein [Phycisphaerales bacterium]